MSTSCAVCTPSPGNTRKVRAVAMRSSKVRVSCHMKSDSCTRKIFGVEVVDPASSGVPAARMWNESMPMPRLGQSARQTTSHAVVNSLTVRPHDRPS
jgi:hypothetical protein